jgi:hypothetical protein
MSYIGVTGASSIAREDFTTHGFHLNPRGKKRLTHLLVEKVIGRHVSSISSIPVITHKSLRFFSVNLKKHRCLTYIKCGSAVSEAHKQNA